MKDDRALDEIKNISIPDIKLDDPASYTRLSERSSRKQFFIQAKSIGREKEFFLMLSKYDNMLKNCSDPVQAEQIKAYACNEVMKLLNIDAGYLGPAK